MNHPASIAPWSIVALLAIAVFAVSPVGADSLLAPEQTLSSGPLDGMAFEGKLGAADENGDPKDDVLFFRNGYFWSKICVPCGFQPGRYQARRAADGIHFRGQLQSPESGVFLYTGVVRDGRILVSIDWTKERWYWTVNREFRFDGELRDGGQPFATLDRAQTTAIDAVESGNTCEPG